MYDCIIVNKALLQMLTSTTTYEYILVDRLIEDILPEGDIHMQAEGGIGG